jgi:hypothetical protein
LTYITLGSRTVTASADQTGKNAGNLTTSFTGVIWNTNVPVFEIYHMILSSVPSGAFASIYLNNQPKGFVYPNLGAEWNPAQPMIVRPTDELDFLWSAASNVTPAPITTAWLRYDPAATS